MFTSFTHLTLLTRAKIFANHCQNKAHTHYHSLMIVVNIGSTQGGKRLLVVSGEIHAALSKRYKGSFD